MPRLTSPFELPAIKHPWLVAAIPVRQDNFVYVIAKEADAIVIDAGEAAPVLAYLQAKKLVLRDILLTHQHRDHTAGFEELQRTAEPGGVPWSDDIITLHLPGHTAVDVGYYVRAARVLFTGDCLINGACGRVLEGRLADLYASLQRIKELPGDTRILGGHDYLLDNLQFALQHSPDDAAALQSRMACYASDPGRALFVSLDDEQATNPFLQAEDLDAFVQLRKAKDLF